MVIFDCTIKTSYVGACYGKCKYDVIASMSYTWLSTSVFSQWILLRDNAETSPILVPRINQVVFFVLPLVYSVHYNVRDYTVYEFQC